MHLLVRHESFQRVLAVQSLRMSFRTAISTAKVVSTGVAAGLSQPTTEITPKLGSLLRVQYARAISITS